MKRPLACLCAAAVLFAGCSAQEVRRFVAEASQRAPKGSESVVPLTEGEAAAGLREALERGAVHASEVLSKKDAYFASALKIPFPPQAQKVQSALNDIGLESVVEDVVESVNRAAEDAAAKAKPVFVDAIKAMTISDALRIVRGSKSEATEYLREKTRARLVQTYRPAVQASLDKVSATKYWSQAMSAYNKIPFVEKVTTDLPGYVTEKALDGLFNKVAEEEALIRANPTARVTEILKRVFGSREAQGS